MGCVSRIIHDGGGGHAAAPLPRRSHAGTMQCRAATVPPPCRRRAAAVTVFDHLAKVPGIMWLKTCVELQLLV